LGGVRLRWGRVTKAVTWGMFQHVLERVGKMKRQASKGPPQKDVQNPPEDERRPSQEEESTKFRKIHPTG